MQSRLISHPICSIFFRVFHSIILAHLLAVPSLPPSTLSSLAECRYPSRQLLDLGFVGIPLVQILEVGSLLDLVYSVLVHSRYYPTSVCPPSFWRVPVCLLMCFLRFGLWANQLLKYTQNHIFYTVSSPLLFFCHCPLMLIICWPVFWVFWLWSWILTV